MIAWGLQGAELFCYISLREKDADMKWNKFKEYATKTNFFALPFREKVKKIKKLTNSYLMISSSKLMQTWMISASLSADGKCLWKTYHTHTSTLYIFVQCWEVHWVVWWLMSSIKSPSHSLLGAARLRLPILTWSLLFTYHSFTVAVQGPYTNNSTFNSTI